MQNNNRDKKTRLKPVLIREGTSLPRARHARERLGRGTRSGLRASMAPGGHGLLDTRRELLRYGLLVAAGLLILNRASWSQVPASLPAASRPGPKGKAKAVIQIWMWGGPCHLDTFDPKPEAGNDYCGPLNKPIDTNVDGIRIGELLPLLAKQADKYSIIRSMTHGINGHETASYIAQTGRPPGGRLVYPGVGAVSRCFKGYDAGYTGLIPPYIVLTEPQGRFFEAGFLGLRYKPFATGGDPAQAKFAVEGVVSPGVNDTAPAVSPAAPGGPGHAEPGDGEGPAAGGLASRPASRRTT